MDLIKVTSDVEKAKNILQMTFLIEDRIATQDKSKFSPLIIADYYEIIKELITAVMLIDGYKTLSHKDLIDYLKQNYKDFQEYEIVIIDDLRVFRNRISYEGFAAQQSYLERNEQAYKKIIEKLREIINKRTF